MARRERPPVRNELDRQDRMLRIMRWSHDAYGPAFRRREVGARIISRTRPTARESMC